MKATLEFNLPEETTEYNRVNQAADMFAAILHFEEKLRKYQKYGHEFKTADEAIESLRALLHEELNIRCLNLYD